MIVEPNTKLPNTFRRFTKSVVCNAVPVVYSSEPLRGEIERGLLHERFIRWVKTRPIRRAFRAIRRMIVKK